MGDAAGTGTSQRNNYGAFTCFRKGAQVVSATQVFKNRELWGLDADCIDKRSHMQGAEVSFGYFPCTAFEDTFKRTLANYLEFAEKILQLPIPLRLIVGATNVQGYRMTAPRNMTFNGWERFAGSVLGPHIVYEGIIDNYQTGVTQILRPFFERVWEECGLERPDKEDL